MLFFALYHVFKGIELLIFDSPAEIDVVKSSLTSAKVFVSSLAGNVIRKQVKGCQEGIQERKLYSSIKRAIKRRKGKVEEIEDVLEGGEKYLED